MSEYQYYEFLALDHPLTQRQIEQVGDFSTRADISPTRFVNTYQWGDFRGKPEDFVTRFFDIMVYVANWGTHRLLIGLPADMVNVPLWKPFASDSALEIHSRLNRVLVDFVYAPEEPEGDFEDGTEWMASLLSIRAELLAGDTRPLYLAWLANAYNAQARAVSPPIPPGLAALTPAQKSLARFLQVDEDLLSAAIADSPAPPAPDNSFNDWITALPRAEKDRVLRDLLNGQDPNARTKLLRRHQASVPAPTPSRPAQPLSRLLATADALRTARESAEREQAARNRARLAAKHAADREKYLDSLRANPEAAWRQVDEILRLRESKSYPQAIKILTDLRDLARRDNVLTEYIHRLKALHQAHRQKSNFIKHLHNAKLLGD